MDPQWYRLHGEGLSPRYQLRFNGGQQLPGKRVGKALALLKGQDSNWREFWCKGPTGRDHRLPVGLDKARSMVAHEIPPKKLKLALAPAVAMPTLIDKQSCMLPCKWKHF